jgi:hypothetical protein
VTAREKSVTMVPRGSASGLRRRHVLVMSTGFAIGFIEGSLAVCCGDMLFRFACRMSSCRSGVGCSLLPVAVSRRIVFPWEVVVSLCNRLEVGVRVANVVFLGGYSLLVGDSVEKVNGHMMKRRVCRAGISERRGTQRLWIIVSSTPFPWG